MKTKLGLLLAVLTAFFAVGSGTAFADTIATVDISPTLYAPTYAGTNGVGVWSANWKAVAHTSQGYVTLNSFQIEPTTYLYVPDQGWAYHNYGAHDIDNADGTYNPIWDSEFHANVTYKGRIQLVGGQYGCPFPGFHWFGEFVSYRWRQLWPTVGAWSSQIQTSVSGGVYGQVCL